MIRKLLLRSVLVIGLSAAPAAFAQTFVSVRIAPPPLPVYAQPPCPVPGAVWTPGYWAWSATDGDYFWVPGTWVLAPRVGYLWTPGYWAWDAGGYTGGYVWHSGYWAPYVGFYGGIHYGYGYPGDGFYGGYWRGRAFYYNRAVNNVDVTIVHNVYRRTVTRDVTVNRISYDGGRGGVDARPRDLQRGARGPRLAATREQLRQRDLARDHRAQFAAFDRGRPRIAATPRPGGFASPDVVRDRRDQPLQRRFAAPPKPPRRDLQRFQRSGGRPVVPEQRRQPPPARWRDAPQHLQRQERQKRVMARQRADRPMAPRVGSPRQAAQRAQPPHGGPRTQTGARRAETRSGTAPPIPLE